MIKLHMRIELGNIFFQNGQIVKDISILGNRKYCDRVELYCLLSHQETHRVVGKSIAFLSASIFIDTSFLNISSRDTFMYIIN